MIYEVINGKHRQGNKRYAVGEKINSDKDLIKVFPNKFKVVEPVKEIIEKEVVNIAPQTKEEAKETSGNTDIKPVEKKQPKKAKAKRKSKSKKVK